MEILNKTNMVYGVIATFFAAIFGKYWMLFAGFLVLNAVDWITGYIKSKILKTESSKTGAMGILKKVCYWCVLAISFFVSIAFIKMGELLRLDLGFVVCFGYFTLATYLVNEIRSILENFVEMGVNVPKFLIIGLRVASKKIEQVTEISEDE